MGSMLDFFETFFGIEIFSAIITKHVKPPSDSNDFFLNGPILNHLELFGKALHQETVPSSAARLSRIRPERYPKTSSCHPRTFAATSAKSREFNSAS